jgi:hypothetical protein
MVSIKVYLISKEVIQEASGKMYVKMVFADKFRILTVPQIEVEDEDTKFVQKITQATTRLVQQMFPTPAYPSIRFIAYLTWEEYEKLPKKPDIQDEVIVEFTEDGIKIKPGEQQQANPP